MNNELPGRPFWANNPTAVNLWDAFLRIKAGHPVRVKKEKKISLSAVATEAGYQRSLLSRHRFPELCALVDELANSNGGRSMHSMFLAKSEVVKNLRVEIAELKNQQSLLVNQLTNLQIEYMRVMQELTALRVGVETGKIVVFSKT